MAGKMHLWPEDRFLSDGFVTVAALLERPGLGFPPWRLWYRLPAEYAPLLAQNCDPLLVGAIFSIMGHGGGCIVHGQVSPSLLRNLEEFQAAWACWQPKQYTRVEITADSEQEAPAPLHPGGAVLGFSGGVDSAFSAWRHHTGRAGRLSRHLHAGVMMHGFDIGLDEPDIFDQAMARSRRMLDSIGLLVIPLATNFRALNTRWTETQGAGLASCLMLLAGGYGAGLISSSYSYRNLRLPHGSNPLTDGLMSSDSFHIIHDGAGFNRIAKIQALADWPAALRYLRVCWEGKRHDLNCGKCRKCVRTILEFRAAGLPLPPCFDRDVNPLQIATVTGGSEMEFVLDMADTIKTYHISGSWLWAFYIRWGLSQLRHWGKLALQAGQ